jgi:hypothetical protein
MFQLCRDSQDISGSSAEISLWALRVLNPKLRVRVKKKAYNIRTKYFLTQIVKHNRPFSPPTSSALHRLWGHVQQNGLRYFQIGVAAL